MLIFAARPTTMARVTVSLGRLMIAGFNSRPGHSTMSSRHVACSTAAVCTGRGRRCRCAAASRDVASRSPCHLPTRTSAACACVRVARGVHTRALTRTHLESTSSPSASHCLSFFLSHSCTAAACQCRVSAIPSCVILPTCRRTLSTTRRCRARLNAALHGRACVDVRARGCGGQRHRHSSSRRLVGVLLCHVDDKGWRRRGGERRRGERRARWGVQRAW